ncbi:MAG: beta-lactamase family protein, partial [Candidatus Eremiobacteraeota bacterium]|nr:beta-lactamase family protein [Candidatus Eremiobacteraeota bacterium]
MSDSALAEILSDVVRRGEAVGIVAGVATEGREPTFHAVGSPAIAGGEALHSDSRFAIGSLTKQFTAACVLLLRERGQLSFEDRLDDYVADLVHLQSISLGQLLHHTSGLPKIGVRTGADPYTASPLRTRIAGIDPRQCIAPGVKYRYSNWNYWLLGRVVEVVSGRSYADFLHEEIFRPLGMTDSSCDPRRRTVLGHTGEPGA